MDYTTLIDRILEAERSARDIADEVKERQANLETELEEERSRIREKYMQRAKDRLEKLGQEEQARKERMIAAQDARLAEANAKMERAYSRYGDNWVNTLFHQTVDVQ